MEEKKIIIVAGEVSGDMHAAGLLQHIKSLDPSIKIFGVGGDHLKKYCEEIFWDIKKISVFGIIDVFKKLHLFIQLKNLLLKKIKEISPDLIILVDFSGFNLRLAKTINKKYKVIYYISPQIWASRTGRVVSIKKYIHKILVFFQFEKEFYQRFGIDADWIGHPLVDMVRPLFKKEDFFSQIGLSCHNPTFTLLPGSRLQEVKYILPIMLSSATYILKKLPQAQFIIARTSNITEELITSYLQKFKINAAIIEGKTYDCIAHADFCLVASGTATLETAILKKPFVIIYKMNLLNYFLFRPQVKVAFIGMVNIIAQKKIIPEFIQFKAQPKKIAETILSLLSQASELQKMQNDLQEISLLLGPKGVQKKAAGIVLEVLKNDQNPSNKTT